MRRRTRVLLLLGGLVLGAGGVGGAIAARRATGAAGSPLASYALPEEGRRAFAAEVLERVPAGGYTYLRVREAGGAASWIATMGAGAEPGARVTVRILARAEKFRSRRLQREFAPLSFGFVTDVPSNTNRENRP